MTSGAIQKGVPTKVDFLLRVLVICPATPKSARFTSPFSDRRMLAAEIPVVYNQQRISGLKDIHYSNICDPQVIKKKSRKIGEIFSIQQTPS